MGAYQYTQEQVFPLRRAVFHFTNILSEVLSILATLRIAVAKIVRAKQLEVISPEGNALCPGSR